MNSSSDYVQQTGTILQSGGIGFPAPPYALNQNMGWSCPRCGRCYAPTVQQCMDRGCQPPELTVPYAINDLERLIKESTYKKAVEAPSVRQGWEIPVGGCGQEPTTQSTQPWNSTIAFDIDRDCKAPAVPVQNIQPRGRY